MMFFQDTRAVGLVFWIVVILMFINAGILLTAAFTEDLVVAPEYVKDVQMYYLLIGIGSTMIGVIYAVIAHRIMSVRMTRMQVLRSYVAAVGMCAMIGGIFEGLAEYLYSDRTEFGITILALSLVLGAMVMVIAAVIGNGKKGFMKKVIWVILVISLLLMAVKSLIPSEEYWGIINNVAHLMIAFFMLVFIADSDVMKEMGVTS